MYGKNTESIRNIRRECGVTQVNIRLYLQQHDHDGEILNYSGLVRAILMP